MSASTTAMVRLTTCSSVIVDGDYRIQFGSSQASTSDVSGQLPRGFWASHLRSNFTHSRSLSKTVMLPQAPAAAADLPASFYTSLMPESFLCCRVLQALFLCRQDFKWLALLLALRAPIAKQASLSCSLRNSARMLVVRADNM